MQNFRELSVYQKAYSLVLIVYRLTRGFPSEERYGLTSQIRRCASSIPANIAEGCGPGANGDFSCFLRIAAGSASELEFHLELARDLTYLHKGDYESAHSATVEVKRML